MSAKVIDFFYLLNDFNMKTIFTLFIFLFFCVSSMYSQEPSPDCIIANYDFNGNALDNSGNGYDGVVYGATLTTNQDGQANMAYLFDATNDFIEVPNFPNLGTGDFSLELWMNTYSYLVIPPASRPISKGVTSHGSPSNAGFCIQLHELNGVHELRFYLGHSNGQRTSTISSFVPENEWLHVVATREGTTMSVYINGVLSATETTSVIYNVDTNVPLAIGTQLRNTAPSLSFFDGKIETCRMYKKALTEGEINFLYNSATLAVELTSFTAVIEKSKVLLNWETPQETNHQAFFVEHSTDGYNFNKIDKIEGRGDSQHQKQYTSTHYSPSNGLNYYRLKQVDIDNTFKYFPIKVVDFKEQKFDVSVFPTVVSQNFTVSIGSKTSEPITQLDIFNQLGQLVYTNLIPVESQLQEIDCSSWQSGLYFIHLRRNQKTHISKIMKMATP